MRFFVRFIEVNPWEKETWRFYLPLEENARSLRILRNWIRDSDGDGAPANRKAFHVDFEPLPEEEVQAIVLHGRKGGYMPTHNLLDGTLDLTRIPGITADYVHSALIGADGFWLPSVSVEVLAVTLWKGGIRKLVVTK